MGHLLQISVGSFCECLNVSTLLLESFDVPVSQHLKHHKSNQFSFIGVGKSLEEAFSYPNKDQTKC
jgi:hypothetical protein